MCNVFLGDLMITEACKSSSSFGIGTSPTETMSLTYTEVNKITANYNVNKYITFKSTQGILQKFYIFN